MFHTPLAQAQVGDTLAPLVCAPVSRTQLALFAGASNDHNPIHIDIDFARAAGLPDVIAHGMLSMASLARLLTGSVPAGLLRQFDVRFAGVTRVGDQLTCTATVVERFDADGETRVRLRLQAADQKGEVKVAGEAVAAVPTHQAVNPRAIVCTTALPLRGQ